MITPRQRLRSTDALEPTACGGVDHSDSVSSIHPVPTRRLGRRSSWDRHSWFRSRERYQHARWIWNAARVAASSPHGV